MRQLLAAMMDGSASFPTCPLRVGAVMLLAALAVGRGATPPGGLSRDALAAVLRGELASRGLRGAGVGLVVFDLVDRELVFAHRPDELLIVASNNKLATTAAALERLGPDFQFRTTVAAHGTRRAGGVLDGALVVIGRGEPSLSGRFHEGKVTARLEEWAEAVAEAGIREVRGDLIADDTYFDRQLTHPGWPDGRHAAWYCAQVCALSFNDNCVDLTVRPGARRGALAVCSVRPPTGYVHLHNSCRTTRARRGSNRVLVHRRQGGNEVYISGHIREGAAPFHTPVTVHEPALYAATVFREVLEARGIAVSGQVRRRTPGLRLEPEDLEEIITTTSTLAQAVGVANSRSQNFYAEQILKTLGREARGEGSFAAGCQTVTAFLREAGIQGAFSIRDGSGLARTNRFSARQIAALLAWMNCRRTARLYWHSLAEPGKPGTLSGRRRLRPLAGHLFAKTGYIARVCALSGYLECVSGRLLAFSILVNNYRSGLDEARAAQDRICLALARYAPRGAAR